MAGALPQGALWYTREPEGEHGLAAGVAAHGDRPAMQLHDRSDDGESEPGSLVGSLARDAGTEESVEYARQDVRRNARSSVNAG